ncbi:hypothetical protein [Azorhizobium doebereinerae]|uniref:hypothetical protein n=1 Tax=Azorhizobium doebereinerae TaxID=281091 RepID=UPI000419E0C8|nr:hypothetical protein [Azorhizobium doebereinerae]
MRRGPFSPLAITLALLMATTAVRAETFDLFGLLRPHPAAEPAATPDGAGGADDVAPLPQPQTLAVAPLPLRRPAVVQDASAAGADVAPLPQPQVLAAVPLPPHRPKITSEPSLLLLQIPSAGKTAVTAASGTVAAPAAAVAQAPAVAPAPPAAPAVVAQAPAPVAAQPVPAPVPSVAAQPAPAPAAVVAAPVAPAAPVAAPPATVAAADTPVSPVERAAIPFPMPRPAVAQAPGVQPKPVRTVTVAAPPAHRPAEPAPVAVAAATPARETPAPRAASSAPLDAGRDLASDPMPVVSLEPSANTLSPEAMSAIVIAQTEREGLTAAQDLAAAKAAGTKQMGGQDERRVARDDAPPPVLPPDPAAVADAMLQRIPTVTSAIAGIVSAVSPTSAYAGANTTQTAQAAPAGQAQAAPTPADVTRVERPTGGPAPYEMVRRLQRLQDRIANGDTDALQAQRVLIAQTEEVFRTADPQVWQDPRNARGAVIFFLSGGAPTELRRLLTLTPKPAVDERLLQGALAYVEGRQEDAERYLSEINAMQLPDALGGQIAMAQAAVTVSKDPKKAMGMLDVARLMMPGTLVEEAALRREILVAAQLGDLKQFEQLSRQYLFRFRYSVYAGNFRQRFAAALTRMAFVNDGDQFHRLTSLLAPLDRDSRLEIYLMVARGALNQGKLIAATMASDKVIAEAPALSSDAERARVYRSAVRAASSHDVDVALAELRGAERSRLPPEDVLLLNAAITTAELVKSAGETVKVAATKPSAKVDPMKITAPASGGPALVPRWPAAEPAAQVAEAKATDQKAPDARPAAPAGGSVQASAQPAQAPAATQPTAAAAPAPVFDDGSTANALVSRAQGTLSNVDALLKDAPK